MFWLLLKILIGIVNFTSTGIFHRKALLKYFLFVLRQCLLFSSIILEFLTTSVHCVTLKSPTTSRTATLELQERVRIFLRHPSFLVRRTRFAISLYQLSFVVFIFFIPPEIRNVSIWLLTQGCQSGFRFARIIGPGNVGS